MLGVLHTVQVLVKLHLPLWGRHSFYPGFVYKASASENINNLPKVIQPELEVENLIVMFPFFQISSYMTI